MSNYLAEAFTQLKLLENEQFSFDKEGAVKLANFMEDDALSDLEVVIDPEAETEEDLKDSYIGMGILGCEICKSMIYKDMEDIHVDEEAHLANVGECCPYCYSTDGFKVVGKVAPFEDITVETDKEGVNVEVNGKDVEVDVEGVDTGSEESDQLEEALDTDTVKYQEYVDHDIQEYGKVAESTITELERAGLTLTDDNKVISKQDREDEEIDPRQKYPVESPFAKKDSSFVKKSGKYPVEKQVRESTNNKVMGKKRSLKEASGLSNMDKLFRAYPELAEMEEPVREAFDTENGVKAWNDLSIKNLTTAAKELGLEDFDMKDLGKNDILIIASKNGKKVEKKTSHEYAYEFKTVEDAKEYLEFELPSLLDESLNSNALKEGMEDISITTDDQVIKVKATPRTDKEEIVPVEPKEVEAAQPVEDNEEEDMEMVDIEDIDETSFDELGESYLKKVYDNVKSYRTSDAALMENKIKLEGIITFNSGKKAKTNFIFEAKEMSRNGKLKFVGENVNLSKNKKAFTITASNNNGKLITESFNYNYLGKDSVTGKTQRLYGTLRK